MLAAVAVELMPLVLIPYLLAVLEEAAQEGSILALVQAL
jgi:hypothetical protein